MAKEILINVKKQKYYNVKMEKLLEILGNYAITLTKKDDYIPLPPKHLSKEKQK